MIKEIKYNGFTETPSDYECPDGDLATVTGLVPEDEALHPVQPPVTQFTLPEGYTIAHIHKNTGYKNYIIRHDYNVQQEQRTEFYYLTGYSVGTVYTGSAFTADNLIYQFENIDIYNVNSIGNTLLILTSDGMYYSLWKFDETLQTPASVYKKLGNSIPETHISFGLKGSVAVPGEATMEVYMENLDGNELIKEFGDQYENEPSFHGGNHTFTNEYIIDTFTNRILGAVNSFIAKMSVAKGKFLYPFMVRYAYRLYDNKLTMHSQPVLMVTDSYCTPHCFMKYYHWDSDGDDFDMQLGAMLYDLDYKAEVSNTLSEWSDIVKSVDIFISAPIYTYNQAKKVTGWSTDSLGNRGFGLLKILNADSPYQTINPDSYYCKRYLANMLIDNYGGDIQIGQWGSRPDLGKQEIDLPRFTFEELYKKIHDCHEFYLFKSIEIDKLETVSRSVLELPKGFLSILVNQEAMTDDLVSHDKLTPEYSFTYNSRLNIARITKELRNPFTLYDGLPFVNYTVTNGSGNTEATPPYRDCTFYVFIKENFKEYVIACPATASRISDDAFQYFYYPNPNAYKCVVKQTRPNETDVYKELLLIKHDFLNGAVFFEGWEPTIATCSQPSATIENTVEMPNKLYTSEVNNPFVYLSAGVKTIGMSSILGIRPSVKAMSPAQFGQFKFYVFTLDGVWALEVNSEGYFQMPQLVAPDIVLGDKEHGYGKSITQVDGAVIFASERGIMMLEGSKCTCISDILNSQDPFIPFGATPDKDVLPGLRSVCGFALDSVATVPFRTFIQDCSMLYDYPHQRIIVYSPSYSYAYAFSTKSKLWGMIPSAIHSTILDYPYATCMVRKARALSLADYSKEPSPSGSPAVIPPVQALIITRPLKLDMPDVLKTIYTVIQRGNFRKGHVQSVLYGSRELEHWFLIKSSVDQYLRGFRGTPYKYFRIALICNLDKDESIFGCSVSVMPRYQNRLR